MVCACVGVCRRSLVGGGGPTPPAESAETGAFIEYYSRLLGVSKETLTADDADAEEGGEGDVRGGGAGSAGVDAAPGWD